jgi:hypothetical protein
MGFVPNHTVTINLEMGLPTVQEARRLLKIELEKCRDKRVRVAKLIHGYGSTGVGGALRQAIRKSLLLRKKEGVIAEAIFGEKWDIFQIATQRVLQRCPELSKDSDLQRCNPGITIILFNY